MVTIIHANVAARCFGERNRGSEREPSVPFMRSQIFASCYLQNATVVVPAAYFEMRRAKYVHPQLSQKFRGRI
jgi:hypothetical protein